MPETTGERWTTEQCAEYLGLNAARNYRSYVTRLGAPGPVGFNAETGRKEYDADAVKAWHAGRRGRGRPRITSTERNT